MKRPDPNIKWKTRDMKTLNLGEMDYNHLKNCKKMIERSSFFRKNMYQQICEEIKYRDFLKKDDKPTSRFELMDFD